MLLFERSVLNVHNLNYMYTNYFIIYYCNKNNNLGILL